MRHFLKKLFFFSLSAFIIISFSYGIFFVFKFHSFSQKISIIKSEENSQSLIQTLKSITGDKEINLKSSSGERINILLLGIAGKGKPGQNLTDTIMLASLNLKTNQVALFSIPRDLFAQIPDSGVQMKINSVYQFGLNQNANKQPESAEPILKTVENITGQTIDYYVILNFNGFEKIIDSVGGININNERDIYDPRYPGPNYSYETFKLEKGLHHLDGATALKYARERHNDPEGDFGRAKRQQQIMEATKNKIFSVGTLLNVFSLNDLFNALGENIITDIQPDEIMIFAELLKKLDTRNINNVVIDAWNKESLLKVSHVLMGNVWAFVLVPRIGNYSEVQELAENIFDLNKIKRTKEEISKENATIIIINKSSDRQLSEKIKKLLSENFSYKNVIILLDSDKRTREKTMVFDFTNGLKPFTLNEIATKIPAAVSYQPENWIKDVVEDKNFDIVLVIGKDIEERYNIEEGTIEDLNKSRDDQEYLQLNSQ